MANSNPNQIQRLAITSKQLWELSKFAALLSHHTAVTIWLDGRVTCYHETNKGLPLLSLNGPTSPNEINDRLSISSFVDVIDFFG